MRYGNASSRTDVLTGRSGEREFIQAANGLKTLQVTPREGMSIDPEEIRAQLIAARQEYKHLVRK
jgi:hypothetical protein